MPIRRETSYSSLQERRQAEEAAKAPPLPVLQRNQNKGDLSKAHDAFMEGKVSVSFISRNSLCNAVIRLVNIKFTTKTNRLLSSKQYVNESCEANHIMARHWRS